LLLFKIYQLHQKKQKEKQKAKKKGIDQKDVYWILPQKTKQEKIG